MNTPQQIQLRKQEKFIGLRAEGLSYMAISKKLRISRETCSKWEKELGERLDEIKAQAEIMTTPEKDSVLSMIQELKAMKDSIDDHNPEKEILTVSLPRGGAKK